MRDPRVWPWLLAGLVAGHAQAAIGQTMGFLVIDRTGVAPAAAQPSIGLVLMAGAGAALLAQWGIIPQLKPSPKRLVAWGAALAAMGALGIAFARDLHALALAFALASLGFGFLRPGFTAGASLAVGADEQDAVAGRVTAINGLVFVLGPTIGVLLYGVARPLPYLICAGLLIGLAAHAARRLR